MPNPGTFHGLRKEFLVSEKPAYAAAVAGGCVKDALAIIQRRFFKRFPIELSLDEEPTPEHLAAVNDDGPDADQVLPDENEMRPEEYKEAVERLKERQMLIVFRKGQIRRWFAYQYMKDHDIDPKDTGPDNPYHILLHKLTGKGLKRPRQKNKPAAWRKMHMVEIEEETRRRAQQQGVSMAKLAGIREQVAKEKFEALDPSERDEWIQTAKEEHDEAVKKWEADANSPLSTAPEDRQRCILGLTQFMQPILDMVCEATGWKATLVAGGPEPAHGGRLSMLSIHSGTTSGDVKMNFGHCEQARYKKQFVPMYGDFLRKCYTPEDCRACTLSTKEDALECMANIELPQQVNLDQILPAAERRMSPISWILSSLDQDHAVGSALTSMPKNISALPPAPTSRAPSPVPSPAPSRCPSRQPSPPVSPPAQAPNAGDNDGRPVTRRVQASPAANGQPQPMEMEPIGPSAAASEHVPTTTTTTPTLDELQPVVSHAAKDSSIQPATSTVPFSAPVGATRLGVDTTATTFVLQPPGTSHQLEDARAVAPKIVDARLTAATPSPQRARKDRTLPLTEGQKRKRLEADAVDVDTNAGGSTRPPKRKRDNDSSSSPTVQEALIEPTAPLSSSHQWFEKAKGQFSSEALGEVWSRLLEEWEAFEEEENAFDDNRVLPAKHRPKSVGMWISRARLPTWRPSAPDAKADEQHFKAWWATLQPAWWVANGKAGTKSKNGDWSALRLPGVNGVQSIVAALFFWGLSASPKVRTRKAWTAAVKECTEVFEQLRAQARLSA